MSGYRIEPAASEHLPAVAGIELAAATMFPEADLPPAIRFLVTEPDELRAAQAGGRMWVAVDPADRPVGFAVGDIVDGNAHLDELDVHPDHGRQGIGTRLLETFLDWARNTGHSVATLVTFDHLPWNAPFYAKHGFVLLRKECIGPELSQLLTSEAQMGLEAARRVCMRRQLNRSV